MKRFFLMLLRKYSKTEKGRMEILKVLQDKVSEDYPEQTVYGNLYNFHIECLMSNELVNQLVGEDDEVELDRIEKGLTNSYHRALTYIEDEDEN